MKGVRVMNRIIKYFFDEDEYDLIEDYKRLGMLAAISLSIIIFF